MFRTLLRLRGGVLAAASRTRLAALVVAIAFHAVVSAQSPHGGANTKPQAGANVNAAAGIVNPADLLSPDPSIRAAALVKSDILLQRQNETMVAGSTRNADHLLAVANDYRFVDFPDDPFFGEGPEGGFFARLLAKVFRRPSAESGRKYVAASVGGWSGVYRSCDRGGTWLGSAVPGSPLDNSPASLRSPLKALSNSATAGAHAETTDPVLVAGPGGRMHLVNLGYIRWADGHISDSRMYYSSYTDRNNLEGGSCFNYDYTIEIDRGTAYATTKFPAPFIDKPSMAVDKDGTLYVSYTVFQDEVNSKIVIARSVNGGATWLKTQPILSLGFLRNHGTTMAVDQLNGIVYVAWRLFYQNWPLMVISKSYDRGRTFLPPTPISHWWPAKNLDQIVQQLKLAKLQPFDQFSNNIGDTPQARSLGFPNIVAGVVNGQSKLFAVWQERADVNPLSPTFGQPLAEGSPRVMFSMSSDGGWGWTPRRAIDAGERLENAEQPGVGALVARPSGPQLQPSLSISGTTNSQLLLFYYESRTELDAPFQSHFVSGIDRQIDVRVARIDPATGMLLARSTQVSQYNVKTNSDPVALAETAPGFTATSRGNAIVYNGGRQAFFGDYAIGAPATAFEYSGGTWKWATQPSSSLTMWTDHRDLQYPKYNNVPDIFLGDWTKYTPVNPFGPPNCDFVATRNTNPYFAEVGGVVAGSPQTFKLLNIQRAFVTYVANRTPQDRFFRLTLVPSAGIQASFEQFAPPVTTITTQIFGNSSHTRSVWAEASPTNPRGSIRMNVDEVNMSGQLVSGGYRTSLTLNPDPNNDAQTPVPSQAVVPPGTNKHILQTELHTPQVSAPQVSAFRIAAPQVSAPQVSAPQVSAPQVSAPQVSAPQVSAPQVSAPQVSAPQVSALAPGEPPNGTDYSVTVVNTGNTDSVFNALFNVPNVETLLNSGSYNFQVLIVRTSLAPGFLQTAGGCVPAAETKVQVLANLQVPAVSAPQISAIQGLSAPQISAIATFAVAPEGGATVGSSSDDAQSTVLRDEVKVVLRAIRLRPLAEIAAAGIPIFNPNDVVVQVTSASTNVLNGTVQPPASVPASQGPAPLVVTNTNDSGAGSLRQAILDANVSPDVNRVSFNIVGPRVITPTSPLPVITNPIVIDGTTQPGYVGTPIVELSGATAGGGNGLHISAGSSTIRGLVIRQFPGSGIVIDTAGGNVLEGNYIGTDLTGTQDRGNGGNGIEITDASGNLIGGVAAATRNVVSGNSGEGVRIGGPLATANLVIGNYIGTNAAGTGPLGNSASGIYIRRAGGNTVRQNVVSANTGFAGVAICGEASFCGGGGDTGVPSDAAGNIVQGNVVGLAGNGVGALGNSGFGISVDGAPDNFIGGTATGEGNRIAFSGSSGVVVFNPGSIGNQIVRNSIYSNGGLGIDLGPSGPDGVTGNDTGDGECCPADTDTGALGEGQSGANGLQNFPDLTSVLISAGGTAVSGILSTARNTPVTIDFYTSPVCDPSGSGEGQTWFGSYSNLTDQIGNLAFTTNISPSLPAGVFVTATATTADGTSEFSTCRMALGPDFLEWSVNDGGNGHVYEVVRTSGTWDAAKTAAEGRSFRGVPGHLVTIADLQENIFVNQFRTTPGDLRAWIGLRRVLLGEFLVLSWVTGEPLTFGSNLSGGVYPWASGEPNNQGGSENFVEMFASSQWNDIGDSAFNQGYIVEYDIPVLLAPADNVAIVQNDPQIGCSLLPAPDDVRGYGHQIAFDWTDASSPIGIAGYEVFATKVGAVLPIVNTFVASSQYTFRSCNSFVADTNLEGWEWRVRAKYSNATFSDWTPPATFRFAACRLANSSPCSAPPPAGPPPSMTISSVSPTTGAPGEGMLVVRGTGFPSPASGMATVSNGVATSNGVVFQGPSSTLAYWVRLPSNFPTGAATIQIANPNPAAISNAFPITVAATPGTPIIRGVVNSDGIATTTANPGGNIYIQADGIDTAGSVVRFTQGDSFGEVTSTQTISNPTIGLAARVTVLSGLQPGPVSVSIRQGNGALSAPVTMTVPLL